MQQLAKLPLLGVNIDHVATLREQRGTRYPDPVQAASIAETAGADGITIHLREDRRHIQDRDVYVLKDTLQTRMNLEMAIAPEMIAIAKDVKPSYVCLVPEKREELTTEGGLDVKSHFDNVKAACHELGEAGILVSLFIEADQQQIEAAKESGAPIIEIHTGRYADLTDHQAQLEELARIKQAAQFAHGVAVQLNAGHGLHYHNVQAIAAIEEVVELNIGHSIVARAVMTGLAQAVSDMKALLQSARS